MVLDDSLQVILSLLTIAFINRVVLILWNMFRRIELVQRFILWCGLEDGVISTTPP